jgi:MurNAc alpha-1-phosphate uridylyltransferase
MKAMILAAGRGERMRPLTDVCPKPLLKVNGIPLIEHHIRKLAAVGITELVINLAWLGQTIVDYLQDGSAFGVNIQYSWEDDIALETAGGIIQALPFLVNEQSRDQQQLIEREQQPFLVINGDIFCDYDFSQLPRLTESALAHLFLVPNPEHNLAGDFCLQSSVVTNLEEKLENDSFTFSGIGLYRAEFFQQSEQQKHKKVQPLAPLLKAAVDRKQITGQVLSGNWTDVGTPQRLQQLNEHSK